MNQSTKSEVIGAVIAEHKDKKGALLPILHGIQDALGYISPEVVPDVASALNLSRAEVHGVITFYHYFRDTPPGKHCIQICQAESCQAMGSEQLTSSAKNLLGIDFHQTTADGKFSLEPVYCLGNCACSPSVSIDEEVYGRVDEKRLKQLIEELGGSSK